ncbi:hypothetical protein DTG75_07725 [Salmonella enterica subsp. salamae]|uniref:Uncharacterized protein n=4 Tax=Salmonella enterica TaxID=28901 RepID=A0A6C7C2G0_SALER|nr:hypothetical protein LFZ47_02575 [Salmonella enterica subsp. salamae serovar 55:k:z39 str. 1315K]ECG1249492.1 hypothetical protein [Salmonella enterica subsp. salamae]ECG1476176.1 hypothetical protein [Salmonella enterica subsp. salamae]MJZ01543.1 hypothetical protein [Salmonella enterica subsp. salamae]
MMSRRLIQKASSGSPTYRESTPRSNGKLIYAKVCCSTDNFLNILKLKGFLWKGCKAERRRACDLSHYKSRLPGLI